VLQRLQRIDLNTYECHAAHMRIDSLRRILSSRGSADLHSSHAYRVECTTSLAPGCRCSYSPWPHVTRHEHNRRQRPPQLTGIIQHSHGMTCSRSVSGMVGMQSCDDAPLFTHCMLFDRAPTVCRCVVHGRCARQSRSSTSYSPMVCAIRVNRTPISNHTEPACAEV
jgi:hypothetical protein